MTATVDLETGMPAEGLQILAELTARFGALTDVITRDRDERDARRKIAGQAIPFQVQGAPIGQTQAQVGVLATGLLVLDLGGPQVGRKWEIRAISVSDAGNVATAVTGVANWYVGKTNPPVTPIANWVPVVPTAWRWTFPNLPNLTTFSSDARSIIPPDRLYCVITGGTANQSILAQAEIKDLSPLDALVVEAV